MKPIEKELCKAIMNDPDARAQIAGADPGDRTSVIVRLGEVLGLPVSLEAVERFLAPPPDGELSDLELEAVVGGKNDDAGKYIVGYDNGWWDYLWGRGNDALKGGAGDDTMEGLGGSDTMWGGDGNDSMDGGEGGDILRGGAGDDTMDGGDGGDVMWGGGGADSMNGGEGNDSLYGDEGDDTMAGGSGDDLMDGGEGDDHLYGGEGDDEMSGGEGNDTLDGGEGDDLLHGWFGDDSLAGGKGDDTLRGEMGNDTLEGGEGDDVLYGGGDWGHDSESDIFVFGMDDGHDTIINFDSGHDRFLLKGVQSQDDIEVGQMSGSTFIVYGETRIELRDVELTREQVWKLVDGE